MLNRSEAQLAARLGELDLRPGPQAKPLSHPLGENHAPRRVNHNRHAMEYTQCRFLWQKLE